MFSGYRAVRGQGETERDTDRAKNRMNSAAIFHSRLQSLPIAISRGSRNDLGHNASHLGNGWETSSVEYLPPVAAGFPPAELVDYAADTAASAIVGFDVVKLTASPTENR